MTNGAGGGKAVHFRHHHIQQNNVGSKVFQRLQSPDAVFGLRHQEPSFNQELACSTPDDLVVIYDQDMGRFIVFLGFDQHGY